MFNGILIIDKPEDFTSHDVIAKLRGILKMRKLGHSGTLDPQATGILPIFLGSATRAVDYHMNTQKEYVATFKFGIRTDTEDIWGEILETNQKTIQSEDILSALPKFTGKISQIPPMYSAIKINGQRLYDIARNGGTVERKPRDIEIFELELLEKVSENEFKLRILCSKGTYVRVLGTDIAKKLDTICTMTSLRRTKSGDYSHGLSITDVQNHIEAGTLESFIKQTDTIFSDWTYASVDEIGIQRLKNGTFARDANCLDLPSKNNIDVKIYFDGNFICLGKTSPLYDGGRAIFPTKSFF